MRFFALLLLSVILFASEPRTKALEKVINIEPSADIDLIVVGVSTGGPSTLEELLRGLPANFKAPVVIAQHMPATFTHNLAKRLGKLAEESGASKKKKKKTPSEKMLLDAISNGDMTRR